MTQRPSPDVPTTTTTGPAPSRTAVVTGAGRGIGRGLALGLAAAGYDVALLGRSREHLDEVAGEAAAGTGSPARGAGAHPQGQDAGGRTLVVPVDVTDRRAVAAAVAEVQAWAQDGVDLLVNNAGVIERTEGRFADDDVEDAWRVLEVNLRGPMLLTHALLPGMLRRGGGRVVNINSGSGHRATANHTAYGISKGGLARLTTLLDAQYREDGVRVFDLAPGVVRTDMTSAMPAHDDRTAWTPVEASVELLLAVGSGRLDALAGRFLRAGDDTPAELVARTDDILAGDARRLRLVSYGATDPLRV